MGDFSDGFGILDSVVAHFIPPRLAVFFGTTVYELNPNKLSVGRQGKSWKGGWGMQSSGKAVSGGMRNAARERCPWLGC